MEALIEKIDNRNIDSVGIAAFGPLSLDKRKKDYGCITSTPKEKWRDFNLIEYMKKNFSAEHFEIDTDVNSAAMAEYKLGNHNVHSLIYVTVGTGVGVGIAYHGRPIHGLVHPEGGHIL